MKGTGSRKPLSAACFSIPLKTLGGEAFQIGLPFLPVLAPEFEEIGPAIEAGIVPIVEDNAHRIMADRIERCDLHVALAGNERALQGTVALHFRTRRFDAQILRLERIFLAIIEADFQHVLGRIKSQLRRPRCRPTHACSLSESWRASSGSITGIPSRIG